MVKRPVLVTGFEPFDGHRLNASWEVARLLDRRPISDSQWFAARLPCRYGACIDELRSLIDRVSPLMVICLGQAEGRADITIERVALNLRDARIADNGGWQPIDEPVAADGPYAYPARLPVRQLVDSLRIRGYPVSLSNSAGTFVCNDLFYGLMHTTRHRPVPAGFFHLPILPEQRRDPQTRSANREDAPHAFGEQTPCLSLDTQVAAIEAAGEIALGYPTERR